MLGCLLMAIFASAYYKIAEGESRSGVLWGLVSVACFIAGQAVYGLAGASMAQVLPFGLMMVFPKRRR